VARNPYEVAAADLRSQILSGSLPAGSLLPSRKELAQSYNIAVGTAHRAVVLLGEWGLIDTRRGHRAVVLDRVTATLWTFADRRSRPGRAGHVSPPEGNVIDDT